MMDEEHAMIRFVAETRIPGTDPSYHLPAFYELFARWGRVRSVPLAARRRGQPRALPQGGHPVTGLSADRTDFDGKALPNWDGTRASLPTTAGAPSATSPSTTPGLPGPAPARADQPYQNSCTAKACAASPTSTR